MAKYKSLVIAWSGLRSPTLEFIKGTKGWEERQATKKKWTPELAEKASELFEYSSTKHFVVIGDLPGKITKDCKTIATKASYAFILCRDDSKEAIKSWQVFFEGLSIPIIVVAVSRLSGIGSIDKVVPVIQATIVGLNRTQKTDELITSLALLIKERLGF